MQVLQIKNHEKDIQVNDKLTDNLFNGIIYTIERKDGCLGVYDRWKFVDLSAFLSVYKPVYILRKDI